MFNVQMLHTILYRRHHRTRCLDLRDVRHESSNIADDEKFSRLAIQKKGRINTRVTARNYQSLWVLLLFQRLKEIPFFQKIFLFEMMESRKQLVKIFQSFFLSDQRKTIQVKATYWSDCNLKNSKN